jgi:hypothetical protein
MKAIFTNTLNLNESVIGMPFMIEDKSIGVVTEVNSDTFTCEIWDKFCGYEFFKHGKIVSFYLSSKEQEKQFEG